MLKNYIDVYESHNLNNGLCHYRTFSFHWPSNPTTALAVIGDDKSTNVNPTAIAGGVVTCFDLYGVVSENGIYGHSRFCNTDFDDKLACLNLSGV